MRWAGKHPNRVLGVYLEVCSVFGYVPKQTEWGPRSRGPQTATLCWDVNIRSWISWCWTVMNMNPKRCFDAEYSVEHSEGCRYEGCNEVILSKDTGLDYSDSENNFPRKVWELLEIWCNLLGIVAQLQRSGAAWSRYTHFFTRKVNFFIWNFF